MKSEVWSLKSEVWSLKSEVWSLKSEVRSPKSEVRSPKSDVRRPTSEVRSLNCAWSLKSEVPPRLRITQISLSKIFSQFPRETIFNSAYSLQLTAYTLIDFYYHCYQNGWCRKSGSFEVSGQTSSFGTYRVRPNNRTPSHHDRGRCLNAPRLKRHGW